MCETLAVEYTNIKTTTLGVLKLGNGSRARPRWELSHFCFDLFVVVFFSPPHPQPPDHLSDWDHVADEAAQAAR